jgi:hypothetical protein
MVLPGVPRDKRIGFVQEIIDLLLSRGIEGITALEYAGLSEMFRRRMASIVPATAVEEVKDAKKKPAC